MAFQDSGLAAQAAWAAGNRLFAVVADGLLEVQVRGLDGRSVLLPGRKWPLNPNATVLGDGIAVHDALGAKFLAAPFGTAAVAVLRARELDGLTPVALVRRGQVAVLSLLDRAGSYHRGVVQFAADYASCRIALADAGDGVSGDTVTDSGIVARFLAGGALGLEVPASGARREVPAGALAGGMLLSGPSGVFVAGGGRVSKLSLA
jgi:hypothetical protein